MLYIRLTFQFQIAFDNRQQRQDEAGILKTRDYFHSLIETEISSGIPASRIVLGGFSQGGAMALLNGITCAHKLGGIFGLSCYMPLADKVRELIPAENHNKDTPIFMGQGEADPLVTLDWAQKTAELLQKSGFNVTLKTYP